MPNMFDFPVKPPKARHWNHGLCRNDWQHPLYGVYKTMIARCHCSWNHKYAIYGARGIKVCQRWRESIVNFLQDMGDRPSAEHSIGRIDNAGDYCPENCRWETRKQQSRNRRNNHLLAFRGKSKTIVEWSEITGLRQETIRRRINDYGWTTEEALTTPV